MDKQSNISNKSNSRFIIIIIMALLLISIAAWAVIQSVSGINSSGSAGIPDNTATGNIVTAAPASTPAGAETTGSTSTNGQVDMDKLAKDILSKTKFETELKQIDKTVAEELISISEGSELQLYMGNGNYSDEIILITAKDKESAEADQETAVQYLKDMRKSFEAYIPAQAKKISDAFNMRSGCYVVICVTTDIDTAKEIIMAAFE
ncbi:MAG: DUF4358 domain-containing protein [Lachnospiraceae bacterium]|nr:DUF4358 domain-containing protein [Lachnospiraceae bacterium]